MSINFIQTLPLEPQGEFTITVGGTDLEPVTYPEYPDYMKAVVESCANCKFYGAQVTWSRDDKRICNNENMKTMWLEGHGVNEVGNVGENTLAFPPSFNCSYHQLKAEG